MLAIGLPRSGTAASAGASEAPDHPGPAELFADNRLNWSFAASEREAGAARTLTYLWAERDDGHRGAFARLAGPSLFTLGMARPEEPTPYGAG